MLPVSVGSVVSVIALDDRAQLAAYAVDARLADHVRSYWSLRVAEPPAKLRIVPDGHVDLVFDLLHVEAHVSGARDAPFDVLHERPTNLLGINLLPGAVIPLLGLSTAALPAGWRPLSELVGPIARVLAEQLAGAVSIQARLALIEAFLLARLGNKDARVERALSVINASRGQIDIAGLGRASGASPRNLNRLFHQWVGLSPKRFARIVRAQAALRRLAEHPAPDLRALAAELGFADQAHLTREVRAVTGASPSSLAKTFKRKSDSFKA
jgi:AraC-like DNA-binding protein